MTNANDRLPQESAELLAKLGDLRQTEREKREKPISSEEFHRLEREVTRKSHDILYQARHEEAVGRQTVSSDESITDVEDRQEAG